MNLVKAIDLYIMQVDNILYCVAEDDWWNGRKHFRRKDPRVLEYCQYNCSDADRNPSLFTIDSTINGSSVLTAH